MTKQDFKTLKQFSDEKIDNIRASLYNASLGNRICVGTAGSFARREGSAESDLDFFFLRREPTSCSDNDELSRTVSEALKHHVKKYPSIDGSFNKGETVEEMLTNIGGQHDDNGKMTRRILILLEGDWLYNEGIFEDTRKQLLSRYLNDVKDRTQIALFLLNDIIRYYRTICVDYEYKTYEGQKPWGIRNIKLMFSRKLIYISGVLAVGSTKGLGKQEKLERLIELFKLPPTERIKCIVGSNAEIPLHLYGVFLEEISRQPVRETLEKVQRDGRNSDPIYRELKNLGYAFSDSILDMLHLTYGPRHPLTKWLVL